MSKGIVPKKLAKGVDFCGGSCYCYIIRSDLNCYMKARNFHRGQGLAVYELHPACKDGDHYLADSSYFYIIKGNSYRCVRDISTDIDAAVYPLHPNCQGGDHYFCAFYYFYIIFQSKGIYRKTYDLTKDDYGQEFPLPPNWGNGIYYFGLCDYSHMVKPYDEWGIQYVKGTSFNQGGCPETFSFHPCIINFLPGGLSLTKGPSFGRWVCIDTISTYLQSSWQQKITKKVGYEKEKMSSMEYHWNVSSTVSAETGALSATITKSQFSLASEFGGSHVNTENEKWTDATEVEKTLKVNLKPNENAYIWNYQLGLGAEPVLYCRHIRILATPDPPTDNPLPPAAK